MPLHRLRRRDPRAEEERRPEAAARHLQRPRRPRRQAAAVDQRLGPRLPDRRQLRGRADPDRASSSRSRTPRCRCTSTACSRTASTSARCGTSAELARWLREHKRSRFLLTAPPLRLPGAVGSPSTADRHGMKVAIVTGGTSGMGEATARELAKRGWQVAVDGDAAKSPSRNRFRPGRRRAGRRLPPRREDRARQVGPHRRAGEQRRHHQVRQARRPRRPVGRRHPRHLPRQFRRPLADDPRLRAGAEGEPRRDRQHLLGRARCSAPARRSPTPHPRRRSRR